MWTEEAQVTKERITIQKYLFRWGVEPNETMESAENFACPHCGKFSAFCRGDFSRHAATIWRQSVVGFTPFIGNTHAGIAVLRCQHCGVQFVLRLSDQVLETYANDCPEWLRHQAPPL